MRSPVAPSHLTLSDPERLLIKVTQILCRMIWKPVYPSGYHLICTGLSHFVKGIGLNTKAWRASEWRSARNYFILLFLVHKVASISLVSSPSDRLLFFNGFSPCTVVISLAPTPTRTQLPWWLRLGFGTVYKPSLVHVFFFNINQPRQLSKPQRSVNALALFNTTSPYLTQYPW